LIFIKNRKKLKKYLKNKGIETLIHYPKLASSQKIYFKEHKNKRFISAEKFAKFGLSLPLSSGLKKKEQLYIVKCISDYFKKKIN
jgi:dTDP-4-amino-4,6-dideoxygalactose transaminase